MRVAGITVDPMTNAPIVILRDVNSDNTLPIWIGVLEASAIASEVEKMKFTRPMTHDLFRNVLDKVDVSLKRIEVNDLRENVYYATIHLNHAGAVIAVDARPSDAIALALRMSSPIFVEASIIEKSRSVDYSKAPKTADGSKAGGETLENLTPESFGKYKM